MQDVYSVYYKASKRQNLPHNQKLNATKNDLYDQLYQRIPILPAMDIISFKMCLRHQHGNQSI